MTKKFTELTEDTAPALTDIIATVKDPGGTPLSRKVTFANMFNLMQGNIIQLYNNDGVSHTPGTVVIIDTSGDSYCKKTTSSGDPKVIGIAAETIAAGATGKYFQVGQATVLVQGNVARGNWLRASTTSGRAESSGVLRPSSGGIGIALTAYSGGGAGSVTALISIQLSSTAPLQQLATATSYNATGTAVSTSHTTDAGTDLLVVRIGCVNTAAPSSVLFNSVGLTQLGNASQSGSNASIWYLRNPSTGTYTLTVNHASSNSIRIYATNYSGSQSTPLRTALTQIGTLTSVSQTPVSAVGDIVIDFLKINGATTGWAPTAGQTAELSDVADGTGRSHAAYKAGAAGSTTMSYSGSSQQLAFITAAIAGS